MQTRNLKSKQRFTVTLLLSASLLLLNLNVAAGRPDVRQSPFALELQPPLLEVEAFNAANKRAIDSYGNPIDALRPIQTPDGRKVVSAEGVQFEIPNYASGITEIRKPADDLLPPHIDAIAVAEPSDTASTDSTSYAPAPATSLTPPKHETPSTDEAAGVAVEVEQAQLLSVQQQEESAQSTQLSPGTLPDYLLALQREDANIAGPLAWSPQPNAAPLSVIAWDLLPPLVTTEEPQIITEQQPIKHVQGVAQPGSNNIRVSLSSGQGLNPVAPATQTLSAGQVAVVPVQRDGPLDHGTNAHVGSTTTPRNPGRFPNRQRGTVHYSTTQKPRSTTTRPTTTTTARTTTTTTTPRPTTTTTARTTTTTTTTTPRPRSTTTEDPATFYKLDNEDQYAYTLPPWLQEVTDPDLDVAVTFIVPTDNDQYNHSVAADLEPPYEPFVDLSNIQLTPPPTTTAATEPTTTSTTTTTTTTTTPAPTTTRTTIRTTTTTAPIFKAHQQQQQQQQNVLISQTTPTAATTTTTTTTTAATPIEENPFKIATLPPWLKDFDYPDVGPGVPYNPDNFKDTADVGAQTPGASKPNDFEPNGFPNHIRSQYTTNAPIVPTTTPRTTTARAYSNTVTATSAFPSKVTLTLPANSQAEGNEEPTLVLIPPAANADETPFNTESSNNPSTINFAVRFDAPDSSTDSQKIEYTKSDDGKVITSTRKEAQANSVFQTTAPAVVAAPAVNTGKYTGGFGAAPGLLRPQNQENKPDIYVGGNDHEFNLGKAVKANRGRPAQAANGGRYTGGFGAPSGVLSPQQAPRPFQAAQQSTPQLVAEASSNQQSRFGGPPGVLVPFDNVQ